MNEERLDEFLNPFLMFRSAVRLILRAFFGGTAIPVKIKGSKKQVKDFARAISREKKYIETAAKHGLDNPKTYKDKYKLRSAVKKFERSTKLKWPFK